MKLKQYFLIATLIPSVTTVFADEPDISNWPCKYCEFEEGWSGDLTLGAGRVSDDSFKFGEYNGLNEEGGYLIADGNLRYRNEDAYYLDLSASELGLDSRSLNLEVGTQGSYDIYISYDELPHYVSDSAASPYRGIGGDVLSLPSSWVAAGSTGGMTALGTSLQSVDIETQRKNLAVGTRIKTDSPWSYSVDLRHDTKEGIQRTAGSFFFSSAQLLAPVDYVTDEVNASVSYHQKKWRARLTYFASSFRNDNESLSWENAYTPLVAGADSGELALPPDNQFHQLMLSAGYNFSNASRLTGEIAIGKMEQDEALLSATQNTSLTVPALPADSANAEVDTTNARLKYSFEATPKLRMNASYSYSDRDNNTPQLVYDWVTTDSVLATPRSNQPYSYTRQLLKLRADYKLEQRQSVAAGFDRDEKERTFQSVDKTTDNTLWGLLRTRNKDNLDLQFKVSHSQRNASSYEAVTSVSPPENLLMRKYNMADRDRNSMGLYANMLTESEVSIGLGLDYSQDDYDKSDLGLTSARELGYSADVSTMLDEETGLNVFLGHQFIKSSQASSQFGSSDWSATNRDTFNHFGIGLTHVLIEDLLNIGVNLSRASSTGEIILTSGSSDPAFPDLRTDLDSVKLYADYRMDETMVLQFAYWYEEYDVSDWAIDDVTVDTVSNLLSLGEVASSYSNNVVKLSMRYEF